MSKITDEDFKQYEKYINEGLSQREACRILGIARGTMQGYLKRLVLQGKDLPVHQEAQVQTGAKILAFDLETSIPKMATFGRRKVFLNHQNVLEEGGKILCFSYAWITAVGASEVQLIHMTLDEIKAQDDARICAELWELFNQADAIVAHNSSNFDFPVVKTRCMMNGLPPIPTVKVLDTVLMARKGFRFPSNSLAELAAYLGLPAKIDNGGVKTWIDYQAGVQEAIDHMHYYCNHDTALLVQVYLKLRSYGHVGSDFNAGLYVQAEEGQQLCTICASPVVDTGRFVYTSVSKFKELRCSNNHVTRSRKNLIEDRSSLTSNVKLKG